MRIVPSVDVFGVPAWIWPQASLADWPIGYKQPRGGAHEIGMNEDQVPCLEIQHQLCHTTGVKPQCPNRQPPPDGHGMRTLWVGRDGVGLKRGGRAAQMRSGHHTQRPARRRHIL